MLNFTIALFVGSLVLILLLIFYCFQTLRRGWTFSVLFKDFKRKIWMTVSLGGIFLFLYFSAVFLGRLLLENQGGEDLFRLAYHSPQFFIYGGLWLFVCLSLTIYLLRMFIVYLYLTRGKDS